MNTATQTFDGVIHLREWGSDTVYRLPEQPAGPILIGASSGCAIRLRDRSASSETAQLAFDGTHWWIRGRESPHGLRQDGVPRDRFMLTPGLEIGIGTTTLVAENLRAAQLRRFCQRLLGWGPDRLSAVDHALRGMRLAMARRSSLIVTGDGDLVPIAHALHRHLLGDGAPFIVCNPKRRDVEACVRSPANLSSGMEALMVAADGSVCVLSSLLPRDISQVIARMGEPGCSVRLFVCMPNQHRWRWCSPHGGATLAGAMAIQMPPLQIREAELPRIVDEYAEDAIAALGVPSSAFTDDDRSWVLRHACRSHDEIEKATLRLIALRTSGSMNDAALRLGMAAVSLSRWLARRPPLRLMPGVRTSISPRPRARSTGQTA